MSKWGNRFASALLVCLTAAALGAQTAPAPPPRAPSQASPDRPDVVLPLQASPARQGEGGLTFEQRVQAQEAIERVYYARRIWPEGNPDPRPLFESALPKAALEEKVRAYLQSAAAFETRRGYPLTSGELDAELERMKLHSRDPQLLESLFDALGHDPLLLEECVAKPALVARSEFEARAPHVADLTGERADEGAGGPSGPLGLPNTWAPISTGTDCPSARDYASVVWTGAEVIVWGGAGDLGHVNTGGRYNPATDSWTPVSVGTDCPSPRAGHAAQWTGTEMIIWGGYDGSYMRSGGLYNPATDSWRPTSMLGNCPVVRTLPCNVWTGTELIVWGGANASGYPQSGGRYNPVTDSWVPTSQGANCPVGRSRTKSVWTGQEMIIWGGETATSPYLYRTGARYSPATDSWTPTSTGENCPDARAYHTAVWTGSEMVVWGGISSYPTLNTGGRYNPATDTWRPTSTDGACPSSRQNHSAVWTGKEMAIWGGSTVLYPYSGINTGGLYNPNLDSWRTTSTAANCPSPRQAHSAAWMGSEMFIWGGALTASGPHYQDGGRFAPAALCAPDAPTGVSASPDCAGISVAWTGAPGALSYDVIRGGACWVPQNTFANVASPFSDTTAAFGVPYSYWVVAKNACGSSYDSECGTTTRLHLTAPDGVVATPGCAEVAISWSSVPAATRYDVMRGATCASADTTFTGVTSPYADTSVAAGTTYTYWVVAANACETSPSSGCASAAAMSAPEAPQDVTATPGCTGNVISWSPVAGASSYDVRRGTVCGTTVTTLANHTSPYTDTSAVAGTTYAYWVVAKNGCGTSAESACATAARLGVPPAPTGVAATPGCTGIQISWTGNAQSTSYSVRRGTACGTVLNTFADVTSPFTDTTPVAGTTYRYWVIGTNSCGNSANSTCVTTALLSIPAAPGAPTFSSVGCTTQTVSWTAVTGATAYDVYRAAGASCAGAVKVNASPVTGTSYADAGLSALTQYSYHIVATSACGSSQAGPCASSTTIAMPSAPLDVTATGACTGNVIAWSPVEGAASYDIRRGVACGVVQTTLTNRTSPYTDTSAVVGTTYNYWVVAKNACGTSTESACAAAARLGVPAAPTGVAATPGCTGIQISWTGNAQSTSYSVRRGTACGTVLNTFADVTSPFTDTTAVAGTSYRYWVTGANSCGSSGNSACVTTALQVPATPPAAPTFSSVTCSGQTVNWTAVTGATGYDVYRATGASCAGATKLNASPLVGTTYADSGLAEQTAYSYYIVATSPCGNSPDGACATSSTVSLPAAPQDVSAVGACTGNIISWSPVSGASSYDIKRGTVCGTAVTTLTNRTSPSTDTGAVAGTSYTYWVVAKNGCGTSSNSACATAVRPAAAPAVPTGVAAVGGCAGVTVSWSGAARASSYNVLRGTACGTVVDTFAAVASPFTDSTAVVGTAYQYWVVSVNSCGTSTNSSCASGTRTEGALPPAVGDTQTLGKSGSNLVLTWTDIPGATAYSIYQDTSPNGAFATLLGSAPSGTPGLTVGMPAGAVVYFKVAGTNACGVGPK